MLVTALPPPGMYGRGGWGEGEGERVLGKCDEDCKMTLSSSLSPIAGKPSPGDGGVVVLVPAGMCSWDSSGIGTAATTCCELGIGRWEELEAARLSRFLLDTYSSGSVPACCGLP